MHNFYSITIILIVCGDFMGDNKGTDIAGTLRGFFDKVWGSISKSISVVVASIFMIFTLGSVFGYFIATHPVQPLWALMIPPLLGVIGYYYRTFAIVLFILFIVIILI